MSKVSYTYNEKEAESNLTIGKEAVEGMMKGIKRATQAIRLSYGPKGINAVVEHELYPFHQVCNDAETIIQAIEVEDKVENRGLAFLKELTRKADRDSGDGRKTTCIIAETILDEALKANISGVELKRELDSLIPVIENEINKQKREITANEVGAVATIAGESDVIGKLLGDIYKRIGKDGVIIPEGSGTFETSYNIIDGVRFIDTGYLSPFMQTEKGKAVYENPIILVTKAKIEKDKDIEALVQRAINESRALIIFTDDMDAGVAQRLVATHQAKVAKLLIIKAPTLWKQYVFEDFAKVTGATIIEPISGLNLQNLRLEHLGTCGKITVEKEETTIIPSVDFSDHIAQLKTESLPSDDIKLRLSWLQTKTCILKLGANSESELSYFRLKCADAINSSKLALKDGIVLGAGSCLDTVSNTLPQTIAGKILSTALVAPSLQLIKNNDNKHFEVDYNVVDAALVVKNAVRNAIALASTVLTTGIVITLKPKKLETLKDKQAWQ